MAKLALSGSDTVTINNQALADFADGNCVELTFPNAIANVKTGKSGNAIFGFNASGVQAEAKLRIIRGGNDDKFLMNLLNQQNSAATFPSTVLLTGTFIKKLGDGAGNVTSDTYILAGGIFEKIPEGKSNVEGETEQSIAMYSIKFASAVRVIT
jgi:hypothetical protein